MLAISVLTFQQIGVLVEVRAGQIRSLNLRDYLLFALLFPRTLAGPIVRFNENVPQLSRIPSRVVVSDVTVGVCLFANGLFKTTVLADGVADYVPAGFDYEPGGRPLRGSLCLENGSGPTEMKLDEGLRRIAAEVTVMAVCPYRGG